MAKDVFIWITLGLLVNFCSSLKYRASGKPETKQEKICLALHNKYREQHGFKELHWSNELANSSMKWAKVLANQDEIGLKHSDQDELGENLSVHWADMAVGTLGESAVKDWYEEICDYKGKQCDFSHSTGHFTQVIWKETKYMGCAIKKIRKIVDGMMMEVAYTVAQYHPPGNVIQEFKENVGCANQKTMNRLRQKIDCKEYKSNRDFQKMIMKTSRSVKKGKRKRKSKKKKKIQEIH